ncbi:MAG: hypothetical protein HXX13_17220 [Bacteroidetes bacterium]|nr:hypothetical protein [Bacteroidota bacterium]
MENSSFSTQDPNQTSIPEITQEGIDHLLIAARWGKFLAILGFISIVFTVLAVLVLVVVFNMMADKLANLEGFSAFITSKWVAFPYFVSGLIGFVPVYFLNSFSNNITKAVRNNDTRVMTIAFKRLKHLFILVGMYTIIILALFVIAIVIAGSTALIAA